MFTAVEMEWLQALIETMYQSGYKYYLARTVTERNNNYDVVVLFSRSPITGNGLYSYTATDAVVYSYDSSGYSYGSEDSGARVAVSSHNGNYTVPQYEHVYTNAEFSGATLQPDIRQTGGANNEPIQAVPLLVALLVLVLIGFRIFR